jgi:hypothetical protein
MFVFSESEFCWSDFANFWDIAQEYPLFEVIFFLGFGLAREGGLLELQS